MPRLFVLSTAISLVSIYCCSSVKHLIMNQGIGLRYCLPKMFELYLATITALNVVADFDKLCPYENFIQPLKTSTVLLNIVLLQPSLGLL